MKEEIEIEVITIPAVYKYRLHQVIDGKRTGEFMDGREIFTDPGDAHSGAQLRIAESFQATHKFVGRSKKPNATGEPRGE